MRATTRDRPYNPFVSFVDYLTILLFCRVLCEELLEEQNMATQRCHMATKHGKQSVGLTATRLTFFRSPPPSLKWDGPDELLDDHLLGYAVIATLELPDDKYRTYLLESVVRPPSIWVRDAEDRISVEPITNYYLHNKWMSMSFVV